MLIRPIFAIAFATLAFAAVAELRDAPVDEATRAGFAKACDHYERRAAGVREVRPGEFVVVLADACGAAEALVEAGTPEQRRRSAVLLWRISELRRTVDEINAARATRQAGNGQDSSHGARTGQMPSPPPVSPSGEFLIAHRLGVLRALDAWLDTGVQVSLASYP